MRFRTPLTLAVILPVVLVSLATVALPVAAQPPDDPLAPFLRGLADSTDAFFGRTAVAFDTTGIDSLIRIRGTGRPTGPAPTGARKGVSKRFRPSFGYHRATGASLGAGARVDVAGRGRIEAQGSYGFANKEGRYGAILAFALPHRRGERPDGRHHGRLWLVGGYARETLPFAPEHARILESTVAALTTGRDRQSVFERRATEASLRWEGTAMLGALGWRTARDRSMPLVTRFSVWGADRDVAPVTPARGGAYREGAGYHEGFVEIAHARSRSAHVGAEARYTSPHRWRGRLAGSHRLDFAGFAADLQVEAGLAAHQGPTQDRFELGGPVAIPSLPCGAASGNRLVLGKIDLIRGVDLLQALRVPRPSYLVLHPGLFVHGGAAWIDQDGDWNRPPPGSRRGAAGVALVHLPGIPNPATFVRFQMAWPLEGRSGGPRFSMVLGRWHDLAPRR